MHFNDSFNWGLNFYEAQLILVDKHKNLHIIHFIFVYSTKALSLNLYFSGSVSQIKNNRLKY